MPLKWLYSQRLTKSSVGKNVEKLHILQYGYSGNNFAVKHMLAIRPINFSPRYLPKSNKNICPYGDLYSSVYNSIIHNSQKLGNR